MGLKCLDLRWEVVIYYFFGFPLRIHSRKRLSRAWRAILSINLLDNCPANVEWLLFNISSQSEPIVRQSCQINEWLQPKKDHWKMSTVKLVVELVKLIQSFLDHRTFVGCFVQQIYVRSWYLSYKRTLLGTPYLSVEGLLRGSTWVYVGLCGSTWVYVVE